MNKTILMGRLAKDPVIRDTKSGSKTATFNVAVTRYNPNGDDTADFIRCVAFGKRAENIGKYFQKGSPILVEGNIKTDSYKKDDGSTVFTTDVWVENFEFVAGNSKSTQNNGEAKSSNEAEAAEAFAPVDEDIPF